MPPPEPGEGTGPTRPTIAVVVKYYPPTERISGIIGLLRVLLPHLASDCDLVVVSHGTGDTHTDATGIRQIRVPRPFPFSAARAVRRLRPDGVLIVSGIYQPARSAMYFAPLTIAARRSTHQVFLQATNLDGRASLLTSRFLARFDQVCGTSTGIVDRLRGLGRHDAALVAPAVEIPPTRSTAHDFDIGFLNHLNRVKGADLAVASILALQRLRPGSTAVIAGTGDLEDELRAAAGDSVSWHRWLDDEERDELLRRCRVILLPFRTSVSVLGVSQTVLEAMAQGTVVVGADTPAIAAAIEDGRNGLLLRDPSDTERTAVRLAELLDDRDGREALAVKARADAESTWDVDDRAAQLRDVLVRPAAEPPMLQFFLGTKAQYIKTAPLLRACIDQGVPFRLIDSGQHGLIGAVMREELGIPDPDYYLARGGDVTSVWQAVRWAFRICLRLLRPRRLAREVFGGRGGICVVHGDTPSTLLATILARRAGLRVAHLESGLRSFNLLHPFPEELIRIWVMRLADLLFTPNEKAAENLRAMKVRGEILELDANTTHEPLRDALQLRHGGSLTPTGPVLVTCHRVENLKSAPRLATLVSLVRRVADEGQRCVFVVHGPTRQTLEQRGLLDRLDHENIEVRDLVDHRTFVRLLADAPFAIVDGGSIQEEAAVLGTPTLVWRARTERPDGIGENVVLANYDDAVIEPFLAAPERWRRPVDLPPSSPSVEAVRLMLDRL